MVFAAGSELKKSGFQKCLFDLVYTQVDPNQSMTEMFMFIEVFKQAGIAKSVKMAALYVTGGEYRLFLDKSAALEGYKLKHFTNRERAFNWLEL